MFAASRASSGCLLLTVFSISVFLHSHAEATTRFSSVAKCSEIEFAKPKSPALEKCPICEVDDKGTLNCECYVNGNAGELRKTSLAIYSCPSRYAFPRCADHIEVTNGELGCKLIPEESKYQKRCWSCSVDGSKLKCDCFQENKDTPPGKHGITELDMKNCDAPISSCLGVLTCGECPKVVEETDPIWVMPVIATVSTATFVLAARLFWTRCVRR